jgi:hypothetical protein
MRLGQTFNRSSRAGQVEMTNDLMQNIVGCRILYTSAVTSPGLASIYEGYF